MKKLLIAMLAILCVAAPAATTPAWAQFGRLLPPRNANEGYKTGLDVLRLCVATDENELLECLGFLEGVNDMMDEERLEAGQPPCYPADQKVDQIAIQQNLIAYLIAYPERRSEEGAKVVRDSIRLRWCSK